MRIFWRQDRAQTTMCSACMPHNLHPSTQLADPIIIIISPILELSALMPTL